MKNVFALGAVKNFVRKVSLEDTATFDSGAVHPVYATFALARDAEWCGRLFVLDMKEADEEGIGTFVQVTHLAPALIGEEVLFTATLDELDGAKVNCFFTAEVGNRLVAKGRTGQMILPKEKLQKIMEDLRHD